jgi:SAM-dependent methyltransferase
MKTSETEIRKAIKKQYGRLAGRKTSSCCATSCCDDKSASGIYTKEALKDIPQEAKEISAGCGNPVAFAQVTKDATVLDLGSGGGIDVFQAATLVGPSGKVIGVDATPEMVWRARETAEKNSIRNVEFRLGEIEHLPIETRTIDILISNCVINLSPDKKNVFTEAFRVLKPGGKLAISDIVLLAELPEEIQRHIPAWVGCVAGAILEKDYIDLMRQAGFEDIEVVDRHIYTPDEFEGFFTVIRDREEFGEEFSGNVRGKIDRIKISSSKIVARKPA